MDAARPGARPRWTRHPPGPGLTTRLAPRIWVALALAPLAVSAISLVRFAGEFHPTGDLALTELRVRDLGHDAVLTGPYSRDGWYHLGPALYYVVFLPYHLAGGSSLALLLTALIVNSASIAGIAVIARRYGGTWFMIAALLGCTLLVRSLGPEFMRSPWNPTITVLPFGLMVMLAWAMTCGSIWALPTAAVVATYLVQTHVGYLPLAVPLMLLGAAWLAITRRRALRRPAATAVVALGLLWLAPIIDEVANEPGNLGAVMDYFDDGPGDRHSVVDGLRVLSAQFSLDAGWFTGDRDVTALGEPAALHDPKPPLLAVPTIVAAVVLLVRGPSAAKRFVVTVAAALVAGVFAIARTPGTLYQYRLDWAPLLGLLAALLVVWSAVVVAPWYRLESLRRPAFGGALAALGACALVNGVEAARADVPAPRLSAAVGVLTPQVLAHLPGEGGDVVFRRGPDVIAGSVGRGLELSLARSGLTAVAGGEEATGRPPRAVYTIATDDLAERLQADRRFQLVAYSAGGDAPGEHVIAVFREVAEAT